MKAWEEMKEEISTISGTREIRNFSRAAGMIVMIVMIVTKAIAILAVANSIIIRKDISRIPPAPVGKANNHACDRSK